MDDPTAADCACTVDATNRNRRMEFNFMTRTTFKTLYDVRCYTYLVKERR